jgi:hypothetical protein
MFTVSHSVTYKTEQCSDTDGHQLQTIFFNDSPETPESILVYWRLVGNPMNV